MGEQASRLPQVGKGPAEPRWHFLHRPGSGLVVLHPTVVLLAFAAESGAWLTHQWQVRFKKTWLPDLWEEGAPAVNTSSVFHFVTFGRLAC